MERNGELCVTRPPRLFSEIWRRFQCSRATSPFPLQKAVKQKDIRSLLYSFSHQGWPLLIEQEIVGELIIIQHYSERRRILNAILISYYRGSA